MAHGHDYRKKKSAAGKIFGEKTAPQAKLIKETAPQARFVLTES